MASVDQRTQLAGRNRMELLLFSLGGEQMFGINVFKVREVIRIPKLVRVPHSDPSVMGITNYRGHTISVIDMQRATGGREFVQDESNSVIITEYNRSVQGFMVRSVDRIVNMNWKDVMPPPNQTTIDSYLTAVTKVDGKLVQIIDVEKVLSEVTDVEVALSDESKTQGESLTAVAAKYHILVIDDSVVARNQIKRTLDALGVEITLAKNGAEGLKQIRDWSNDSESPFKKLAMVLSDIEMPIMDGYTLTTEIRNDERLKHLYVLLHTSLSGVFNQDMIKTVGANEFIAKFNADDLADAVMQRIKSLHEAGM
ncbi:MAG: chemotaxis protein CheV [Gammaproteobacteria bacterium]|nr:MAG: chemotaxis protein CheV [Gammaproteobacteria bacterium]